MLKERLLEILCCPLDRADLKYENDTLTCLGEGCGLVFRVDDDIPIMLLTEAKLPAGFEKLEDLPAWQRLETKPLIGK